jgi:hypothetical protein
MARPPIRRRPGAPPAAERITGESDASLLDLVDNVLTQGVVLSGDIVLGLAGVDLIYARVSALLCAADRVLPRNRPLPVKPVPHRGPPPRRGVARVPR